MLREMEHLKNYLLIQQSGVWNLLTEVIGARHVLKFVLGCLIKLSQSQMRESKKILTIALVTVVQIAAFSSLSHEPDLRSPQSGHGVYTTPIDFYLR